MPPPEDPRYSLTELADLAGVTPRTIRFYISQGLLPSTATAGPGAKYHDTHLARLHLIKRLQREHQPLAEIRRHLDELGDDAIARLGETAQPPPVDSALDYIRRVTSPPRRVAEPSMARAYTVHPVQPGPLPVPTEPAAPASTPSPDVRLERSQWERIDLAPDVELHVRRPLPRSTAKRVDRLISIARDLLEEDPS